MSEPIPVEAQSAEPAAPPPAREVIGLDASIQVLRPGDLLIVQLPEHTDDATAEEVVRGLRRLGVRCAVFGADMKLIVQEGDNDGSDREA